MFLIRLEPSGPASIAWYGSHKHPPASNSIFFNRFPPLLELALGASRGLLVEEMEMNFIEEYKASHTHPINHLTHAIGIPMIVVSLFVFFYDWKLALALFVVGWIFQFVGHYFEGKPPSFFKNPVFLIVGPIWWLRKVLGLEKPAKK